MADAGRILAAVAPAVADWLRPMDPESPVFDALGRELAFQVSQELLGDDEGDSGYGPGVIRRLQWTPAAQAVADGLRIGRRWSPNLLAIASCDYFGVFSAADTVRRRLSEFLNRKTRIGESPQLLWRRAS